MFQGNLRLQPGPGREPVQRRRSMVVMHVRRPLRARLRQCEANVSGPYPKRWYVRGTGQFWARVDGSIGSRKTSETLGRKWTVQTRDGGMTAIVGNNVSYGPFVQDEDRQTSFHKRRGWKTTQKVAEEESREVTELVIKAVEDALSR